MLGDAWYDGSQSASGERVGITAGWADEVDDTRTSPRRDRIELAAKDDVEFGGGAINQSELTRLRRQRLEQRAQRRDADTAGEQQHLPPSTPPMRERAVWSLGENRGAEMHAAQCERVISEFLHRDAQKSVGRRGR